MTRSSLCMRMTLSLRVSPTSPSCPPTGYRRSGACVRLHGLSPDKDWEDCIHPNKRGHQHVLWGGGKGSLSESVSSGPLHHRVQPCSLAPRSCTHAHLRTSKACCWPSAHWQPYLAYMCLPRFFEDYKKNENKQVIVSDEIKGGEAAKKVVKESLRDYNPHCLACTMPSAPAQKCTNTIKVQGSAKYVCHRHTPWHGLGLEGGQALTPSGIVAVPEAAR
eukprot:1152801-Pelagomonas_calceolata.AAC.3